MVHLPNRSFDGISCLWSDCVVVSIQSPSHQSLNTEGIRVLFHTSSYCDRNLHQLVRLNKDGIEKNVKENTA